MSASRATNTARMESVLKRVWDGAATRMTESMR